VFEVRLTDYPRVTVRTAAVVWRVKAIDADGPHTTLSELIQDGASHAANSQNNHIKMLHFENTRAVGIAVDGGDKR
jgi:hypothetical protein